MDVEADQAVAGRRAVQRKVNGSVFVNYLLSNLGYYTLLPVLPLILADMRTSEAWFVGTALFVLAFSVRASCLFVSRVLHRTTVRVAMSGGLAAAAVGFGVLALSPGMVGVLVFLAVAGSGISVNTLMARSYVALALPTAAARNTAFSAVQIGVNIAAGVGPIAANVLFSSRGYVLCLVLVAALYVVGAIVVAAVVPGGQRPADHDPRTPMGLGGVRVILTDPCVRRVALIAVAGWFLYGQLFSALTLHISGLTGSPLLRSAFFTTNAVLVVLVQLPVSKFAARKLDEGTPPLRFLVLGVLLFAVAFGSMAGVGAGVAGTFLGIVVFSTAETVFTPFVSTAFAGISADRPIVEAFNLLQIVMAVGESLGAFTGGALFTTVSRHSPQWTYWLGLCALAVVFAVPYLRSRSTSREPVADRV